MASGRLAKAEDPLEVADCTPPPSTMQNYPSSLSSTPLRPEPRTENSTNLDHCAHSSVFNTSSNYNATSSTSHRGGDDMIMDSTSFGHVNQRSSPSTSHRGGIDMVVDCASLGRVSQRSSPSPPAEHSAVSRVVGTFELLENVLLRLSPLDLLRARGTCAQFRDMADSSPDLQRRLGQRAALNSPVKIPLIGMIDPAHNGERFKWQIKRLYNSKLGRRLDPDWRRWTVQPISFHIEIVLDSKHTRLGSIARRMYISHPPLMSIGLTCQCGCIGSRLSNQVFEYSISTSEPAGLTLGDLWDVSERFYVERKVCRNVDGKLSAALDCAEHSFSHKYEFRLPINQGDIAASRELSCETAKGPRDFRRFLGMSHEAALLPSLRALTTSSPGTIETAGRSDLGVVVVGSGGIEKWL